MEFWFRNLLAAKVYDFYLGIASIDLTLEKLFLKLETSLVL